MCKTSRGTQVAANGKQSDIKKPETAPLPPNAFLGKPEHVPQLVFIREKTGDGFLGSAKKYYGLFGMNIREVDSVADMVTALAGTSGMFQRICLVSHAHERGMIIPFFTNGVVGTNKEIFREFAKSDLAGLKLLSPFESGVNHLYDWNSVMGRLLRMIRNTNAAVLEPFGLQTGSAIASSELRDFVKFSFDIVYLRNPGRVRRNSANTSGISKAQRTILEDFVGEILNQLRPDVMTATQTTAAQVDALWTVITRYTYAQLASATQLVDSNPELGLDNFSVNDFPTLKAAAAAVKGGFHEQLVRARAHINSQTVLDIRGCYAGEDEDYLEAIREFFGTDAQKPSVTAPRRFQNFPEIDYNTPRKPSEIKTMLNHETDWKLTASQRKAAFTTWAELIRVKPLHLDFWLKLLKGKAVVFTTLTWRSQIPKLFIDTPGLTKLNGQNFGQMIDSLKDFFAVPSAAVPKPAALAPLQSIIANLPAWTLHLLPLVAEGAPVAQRATLFANLQQINTALSQSFVPATSPNAPEPPNADQLKGYQIALLDYVEAELAVVKTFMTAAADSLETGDGIYHYLLFAGLPVFVHGTPELAKNGLFMLDAHKGPALQSWYKCLWKEPLPVDGDYKTATIGKKKFRQVAGLVSSDRTSQLSICPVPRYLDCIRKRPLAAGETDGLCE